MISIFKLSCFFVIMYGLDIKNILCKKNNSNTINCITLHLLLLNSAFKQKNIFTVCLKIIGGGGRDDLLAFI